MRVPVSLADVMTACPFEPDFAPAIVSPSPNFNARAGGRDPDMLVLHYTGMPDGAGALSWLRAAESGVSSHYLVEENGDVHQLVPERARAWHAGVSHWQGESDNNSRSIGIEIVNPGHDSTGHYPDFPPGQIEAVVKLCHDCARRWSIRPERVLAHSDIAPLRKRDPGERFPWQQLAAAGIAHHVEPSPIGGGRFLQRADRGQPVEALQAMLALYGYGVEVNGVFDELTEACVIAFQRHFRPLRVDGVADRSTIETLHRLIAALDRST